MQFQQTMETGGDTQTSEMHACIHEIGYNLLGAVANAYEGKNKTRIIYFS